VIIQRQIVQNVLMKMDHLMKDDNIILGLFGNNAEQLFG